MHFLLKLVFFTIVFTTSLSDNLYCLSNYDLQNIIDHVVPQVVNTVPDLNLIDLKYHASSILHVDVSYEFDDMLDLIITDISESPSLTIDTSITKEKLIKYIEYALLKKCESKDILRIFPELEYEVKRYCDDNEITYNELTQFVIHMLLQKLYPTQTPTHKQTSKYKHTYVPTHKSTSKIKTPAPTHVSCSSSIFKISIESILAHVTVVYTIYYFNLCNG